MRASLTFRYAVDVEDGEIVPDYIYPLGLATTSCINFDQNWIEATDWRIECGIAIMKAAKKRGVKIK